MKRDQNYFYRVECGNRRLDLLELYWYCEDLGHDPLKTLTVSSEILIAVMEILVANSQIAEDVDRIWPEPKT